MNFRTTQWLLIVCFVSYLLLCCICYYNMVFQNKIHPHFSPIYVTDYQLNQLKDFHEPYSKDLIVHTAFFDSRPRDNHTNTTVIFMTVNRTILDEGWIVGCGIDGRNAATFTNYSGLENYLMHDWLGEKPFLYENM